MKNTKTYFWMLIVVALLCSCKDELQDTLFDQMFFESYEGQDIRFLDFQFIKNGNEHCTMHCQMMRYCPEWPRGTFQLRYGLDHIFDEDTLYYADNPIAIGEWVVVTINYNIPISDNSVFQEENTVYVKPCYVTVNGDVFEGSEYTYGTGTSTTGSGTGSSASEDDGQLPGRFSVSENRKVCFSRGNLQYQASTGTWRFAPNQYDRIGNGNVYVSSTYSGWIDLFCWGTSGWNSGAQEYQPYAQSTSYQSYYTGGSPNISLSGNYADADWAYHNAISNGGQQAGLWRCLTHEEYIYMMETRPNAAQKYAYARVNGINGLVILPDQWQLPNGLNFIPRANAWSTNSYSIEQWSQMEQAGAVFLPTTGTRQGTNVFYVDRLGDYWSSTANDAETGYSMSFFNGNVYPGDCRLRHLGTCVRAVRQL